MSEPHSGMLRDRPVIETSVSWRLIWQLRKKMRSPDAAVARVPVRRRRLTCAGRSSVRPHAPTARIPVRAATPAANRSRSKPSRNSRVERGHDCPLSLGGIPAEGPPVIYCPPPIRPTWPDVARGKRLVTVAQRCAETAARLPTAEPALSIAEIASFARPGLPAGAVGLLQAWAP